MNPRYETSAPKRPIHLSVNGDLLAQAKSAGVNLSSVLEHASWLRDNREAIKNENPTSRERFPFLVDVQADLLADLESRVAIPLAPEASYVVKCSRG